MTRKAKVFLGKADCSKVVVGPWWRFSCTLEVFKSVRFEEVDRMWMARDCKFATRFAWGRRYAHRLPAVKGLLTCAASWIADE